MALIKSISGFRGTIGGKPGNNLTPIDIVECTSAYGQWLKEEYPNPKVVIGRDARMSGNLVNQLVVNTLRALAIDVVDLGLSTTPTVELAVPMENAAGGIILTASHNPKQWNALKLLNAKGEFISAADGATILKLIAESDFEYAEVDDIGSYTTNDEYLKKHILHVLDLELVNTALIREKKWKVVVDCINSTGSISVVPLLKELGCEVIALFDDLSGNFAHNPEPLAKHLSALSETVVSEQADFGITIDPDVDRLAFVSQDGKMFGEEYTLVAVADYVLSKTPGAAVSNLSSTVALRDICKKHNVNYAAAAVGEVNVVVKMKEVNAVIGGEGNGGIIYPASHNGRDALVGIGLFLSHFANFNGSLSEFRDSFPSYEIVKDKIQMEQGMDMTPIFEALKTKFASQPLNTIDGLKIEFGNDWVHLRLSNTEPIIRVYAESTSAKKAQELVDSIKSTVLELA